MLLGLLILEFGIQRCLNFKFFGFIDSDWAGSLEDRKSTFGYMFSFGNCGISWSSKKQDIVALSSLGRICCCYSISLSNSLIKEIVS